MLLQAFNLKAHTTEEYEAAFKRIDTDNSGYISMDEINALLRDVLGRSPSDFQVTSFLAFFDSNHDGRISWEEFSKGLEVVSDNMLAATRKASKPSTVPVSRAVRSVKAIGEAPRVTSHGADLSEPAFDATIPFSGTTKASVCLDSMLYLILLFGCAGDRISQVVPAK